MHLSQWDYKRALVAELLGEKTLLREATPDLSQDISSSVKEAPLKSMGRWRPSFSKENEEMPLISQKRHSQDMGVEANRATMALLHDLLDETFKGKISSWAEYAAGFGNGSVSLIKAYGLPEYIAEERNEFHSALEKNLLEYSCPKEKLVKDLSSQLPKPFLLVSHEILPAKVPPYDHLLLVSQNLKALVNCVETLREVAAVKAWSILDISSDSPHATVCSLWKAK